MIISFPSDPSNFITLSPVFYSPDDDAPTLSTGALKKTGLFKQITEHRHDRLTLTTMKGLQIEEPTIQKDLIDYVKIHIHPGGRQWKRVHRACHISLPPRCHNINIKPSSPLWTLILHLKYGHKSVDALQQMINAGHIQLPKGHPKKLAPFPGRCPVCDIMGATKLARGPCVDTTELPIGT